MTEGVNNGKRARCPACTDRPKHTDDELKQFHPERREFACTGAGSTPGKSKVPPWLAQLGVKAGEYFTDSKLRAK
jgi:hypothetical protein